MTQPERRDASMAYISDDAVMEEQRQCRRILQRFNFADRSDFEKSFSVNPITPLLTRPFSVTTESILKWAKTSMPITIVPFLM